MYTHFNYRLLIRSDRVDLLRSTDCYETWRRSSITTEGISSADIVQEEGVDKCPEGYDVTKILELDLFCGHREVSSSCLQIPSSTPAGVYCLMITDHVSDECLVDSAVSSPETEESSVEVERIVGIDQVVNLCKVVKPLLPFNEIIITIE